MSNPRVMYVLVQYPQLSETYIRAEIAAVQADFDISIISMMEADYAYKDFFPFKLLSTRAEIQSEIERFQPHVLHTHWLHTQLELLIDLARANAGASLPGLPEMFPRVAMPKRFLRAQNETRSSIARWRAKL